MDAVFVGLALGVGLVSIVSAVRGEPLPQWKTPRWYQRWTDQVTRSGIPGLTVFRLVALSLICSLLVFVLTFVWSNTLSISAIIACVILPLPQAFVGSRARKRGEDLRVLWPEIIDSMVTGVRAGASLPDLLLDLEHSAPAGLRPYFEDFAREYRASGRFDRALSYLKRRMADPVADRIVEALRLAREVGGADLSMILRDLAVMLREDVRIRGELQARQSWTVNAARLGVAAPWLVLLMISGQKQTAVAYSTPTGFLVLSIGGALTVLAYVVMQRVGRLSVEDRSLR